MLSQVEHEKSFKTSGPVSQPKNMVSLTYFNASLKNLVPASLCLKVVSITLTISVLKIHV